uniref:Potassium channel domain-containing protein n=1 Tax=Sinocyclocheilus rhinocerous TaxID=307959 RepID=A0A673GED5_9TELE
SWKGFLDLLRSARLCGHHPVLQPLSGATLPGWKPSVYHVMLILGLSAIVISCCASAMYTPVEGWAYLDSLYFCFVTFSTIGFGDLVSSQNAVYSYQGLYRLANFFFILTGVCSLQQRQRFLGTPQRHQARLAPQTRTLRPNARLGQALR